MEKQVVFLNFEKKVSQQGEAYNAVTLGEIKEDKHKIIKVEMKTFFVPETDDYSKIHFGTVVECEFGAPKTFGGYPPLVDVVPLVDSPYVE
ncbi:MAG: hypothetical protein IJX30_03485 [Clostridia bacterium]|nr:hypothetical protein [Clostridia bacterium]